MILQLNNNGAWRNVREFKPERLTAIAIITQQRAMRGPKGATWRVISERSRSPRVLMYLEGPDFVWKARGGGR